MDVLYILVRTDLPSMNAGKAMAQVAHASNKFVYDNFIKPNLTGDKRRIKNWMDEAQGFGTTITLGSTLCDIDNMIQCCKRFTVGEVIDPTYPYIIPSEFVPLLGSNTHTNFYQDLGDGNYMCFRREKTCAYIFGDKDKLQPYIGHLELHP